ncbi:hypothetical protein I3843_05G173900 [Carya illinoinensis]|nr:hypothetical protein I3843_05G173900 [Carya illinoinensis]
MSSFLSGKLSIEVEAKSSAPALYEANSKRLYEIPKLCPTYMQKVDLVEEMRTVIGGLLVEAYKSFKFVFQAIPKKEGCVVRWTVEYEKLDAEIPDPKQMLQFAADLMKEIDDNLIMIKSKE